MYDESVSIIEIAIGKFLKTEIKFISTVTQKQITTSMTRKDEVKDLSRVICIGLENIYIFSEDFNELLLTVKFEEITGLIISDDNKFIKIKYKSGDIVLIIRKKKEFMEKLCSYYMIYYMEKYCEIKEIKVTKKSDFFRNLDDKHNFQKKKMEDFYDLTFKRCPKDYIMNEIKGYV